MDSGVRRVYHSKETADGGLLNEYFRKHNLYFPKVFEIQSNAFVYDLVGAGLGWSVSHMLGLMSHEKNTLNICPISDDFNPRKIYFCVRKDFDVRISNLVLDCVRGLIESLRAVKHDQ